MDGEDYFLQQAVSSIKGIISRIESRIDNLIRGVNATNHNMVQMINGLAPLLVGKWIKFGSRYVDSKTIFYARVTKVIQTINSKDENVRIETDYSSPNNLVITVVEAQVEVNFYISVSTDTPSARNIDAKQFNYVYIPMNDFQILTTDEMFNVIDSIKAFDPNIESAFHMAMSQNIDT